MPRKIARDYEITGSGPTMVILSHRHHLPHTNMSVSTYVLAHSFIAGAVEPKIIENVNSNQNDGKIICNFH